MKFRAVSLLLTAVFLSFNFGNASRAETPTLKVGLASLSMFTVMYHVAQDKGFFEKEGVKVEVSHFESGSINMKALLARAVDISDVETGLILGAVANGADLRVFGTQSKKLHFALYAKKDIKSLKDCYGRTFGISGIGGLPHLVALALLEQQKLDPNQMKFVTVGGTGARLRALAGGKIDATLGGFSPKIEKEPSLHRLLIVSPELPLYMAQGLVAYADTLEAKKDAISRFMRGIVKATRWAYDNKAEMLAVAGKHVPLNSSDISQVYDFYVKARVWSINGDIDRSLLAYMQDLGLKTKTQSKAVDLDKLVYVDLYKKMMAELKPREYPKAQ